LAHLAASFSPPALVDSPAVDLERLIATLGPTEILHRAAVEVTDLAYDTRALQPGALYFCVPGRFVDGHELAAEAVARGAVALVVERPVDIPVPQLVVDSTRTAMARAAVDFFGDPSRDLVVAGVTGTNGKTTTSFLLFAMLAAAGMRPGLLGTIETRVGGERRPSLRTTPEAIDLQRILREMLDAGDRSCGLEATSHGSHYDRLAGLRFGVLVFTNLTQEHLDLHGTMESYFEAKRRLFVDGEPPPAAVNVDDPYGRRLADELRAQGSASLVTFGIDSADADVRPEDLEVSHHGARLRVVGIELQSSLLGRFNVENVLGAVAAGRLLGLADDAIARGIASVRGVPGRFEPVDAGQTFLVVVDYSHTPDSLERALQAARSLTDGRVVCVFGCGGDRDRTKRPLMGRVATTGGDVAIVTSDNPRGEDPSAIIDDVLDGTIGNVEVEPDRAKAIARAIEIATPGDLVLIAGKGHEQGQEAAGRTLPFDDREVARNALRRLGARR
jgi:UDP-N-acetylmuramoyl-L-alanyl-D-glutamate--2,6-diaminopimelate ligase